MSTILRITPESSHSCIQQAAQCIAGGGVLAVGTESFYALAASAFSSPAVARVFDLKGRPSNKPMLTLIGDVSQLPLLIDRVPDIAQCCMTRFWPGPLTLVLNTLVDLPGGLKGGDGSVGVRLPDLPFLRSLLMHTGPLTGTSANQSGVPPACTASEVQAQFTAQVDLIMDTGPSPGGSPSTILQIGEGLRVLRHGPVPQSDIEAVLASQGFTLSNEEEL